MKMRILEDAIEKDYVTYDDLHESGDHYYVGMRSQGGNPAQLRRVYTEHGTRRWAFVHLRYASKICQTLEAKTPRDVVKKAQSLGRTVYYFPTLQDFLCWAAELSSGKPCVVDECVETRVVRCRRGKAFDCDE